MLVDQVPGDDEVTGVRVGLLDDCFGELKRLEGAAAALKAKLIACAARTKAHKDAGLTDTGAYVRDRLGVSGREAKKQAELAKALSAMDEAAAALADGELGPEQAGTLSRTLRNGRLGGSQDVEQELLEAAKRSNPEELARQVRRREQEADGDALREAENRAYDRRRASLSQRDSGMWTLVGEFDPVGGEMVSAAVNAFRTPDAAGTPHGHRRTPEQRTADAVVELAKAALSAGAPVAGGVRPHVSMVFMAGDVAAHGKQAGGNGAPGSGTSGCGGHGTDRRGSKGGGTKVPGSGWRGPDGRGSEVPGSGRRGPDGRGSEVPGCDASDPDGGCAGRCCGDPHGSSPGPGGGRVPLWGVGITGSGTLLSPEATARLACDASLTRVVMASPSVPLDVGRATRSWSPGQRRAVIARDGGCRGPGCDRPADWCDVHHIRWWQDEGATAVDNGILLCRRHHRLVHEDRWTLTLERDTGRAVFTDPRGKDHATLPRGAPTILV